MSTGGWEQTWIYTVAQVAQAQHVAPRAFCPEEWPLTPKEGANEPFMVS